MTAYIKQNDLLFRYKQRKSDSIAVGKTDCMANGQLSRQRVEFQSGVKRVVLQVGDYFGKTGLEIGMFLEEPTGLAKELLRSGNDVHVSHHLQNPAL